MLPLLLGSRFLINGSERSRVLVVESKPRNRKRSINKYRAITKAAKDTVWFTKVTSPSTGNEYCTCTRGSVRLFCGFVFLETLSLPISSLAYCGVGYMCRTAGAFGSSPSRTNF